jgi:hypothetical protein
MTKQNQEVGNDSIAAQAQGDITIIKNHGFAASDIVEILNSSMPMLRALAKDEARGLMKELSEEIYERLAKRPEVAAAALKTPDFQYVLGEAAHAYARSGDPNVRDMLVDLIDSRCTSNDRTRVTLSLNEAINKTAVLMKGDFAALSIIFLIRYVRLGATNFKTFVERLNYTFTPLMSEVESGQSVAHYLSAQSCGQITLSKVVFFEHVRHSYMGYFSKGMDEADLLPIFTPQLADFGKKLLIPCVHNPKKIQVKAVNEVQFRDLCREVEFPKEATEALWTIFDSKTMTVEEIKAKLEKEFPDIYKLQSLWDDSFLSQFELSSIGIAIGHANAKRVAQFDADLSIWIN